MGLPNFRAIREQIDAIKQQKAAVFPVGCMVQVETDRFHGIGFVVRDESCPIEKLPVRVESLNVWWYPTEDCKPYDGKMPSWIRSLFREHKMVRVDSPFKAEAEKGS